MVKAQSLIYAIYVCLVVALLCGALLYIANLYNLLNQHYITLESLYMHNQSLVNFGLGHVANPSALPEDDETGIQSQYEITNYGLLKVVVARSIFKNDTIESAHFAGAHGVDNTCIYLTNIGRPLYYSGTVKLEGKKALPGMAIRGVNIHNLTNHLEDKGSITISGPVLPKPTRNSTGFLNELRIEKKVLARVPKRDSLYYNSFLNPTIELNLANPVLSDMNIKGNIVIRSADSIQVTSTANLIDVVLIAPVVNFSDDFKGSVQVFASNKINVGKNVKLMYPSSLVIDSNTLHATSIMIDEGSKIFGAILLNGNAREKLELHSIIIQKGCSIVGDIYCSGKLTLKSNVYGSVYTNKFLHTNLSSQYENCIADIEINPGKRPEYFISVPLFDKKESYGAIKKLM